MVTSPMAKLHLLVLAATLLQAQLAMAQTASPRAAAIGELVLANHILANEGVLDAYGHVSLRDPANPDRFLMSRSMAAGTVAAADILEYDLDGNPVAKNAPAGFSERFIHSEIYRARPDVMAVIHCHSPELVPFSVSSVPLMPVAHLAGFLGGGVPVFEIRDAAGASTDMLIRDPALGKALAAMLGKRAATLMRGHGAAVVGESLHVVVGRAYYMNLNARLQWQAIQLGGKITYLNADEARLTSAQDGYERAWALWKQRATARR